MKTTRLAALILLGLASWRADAARKYAPGEHSSFYKEPAVDHSTSKGDPSGWIDDKTSCSTTAVKGGGAFAYGRDRGRCRALKQRSLRSRRVSFVQGADGSLQPVKIEEDKLSIGQKTYRIDSVENGVLTAFGTSGSQPVKIQIDAKASATKPCPGGGGKYQTAISYQAGDSTSVLCGDNEIAAVINESDMVE